MIALMGNTPRGKIIEENVDKLFVSHQNSSDFSHIKVLHYTVTLCKRDYGQKFSII